MKTVGLTGGIATGKSTVTALLQQRGIPVVDADRAARVVVEPGSPALAAIAQAFGPDSILADGTLDRAGMRARILADDQARLTLNSIVHPAVYAHLARELAALADAGHTVAVVDAALMVETGSYRQHAALLVVSCSPEVQRARLMKRDGMTPDDAQRLIDTQMALADKEAVATEVIWNNDGLDALEEAVDQAWSRVYSDLTR